MNKLLTAGILGTTATITLISAQLPSQAAVLVGSFDLMGNSLGPQQPGSTTGSASFSITKDPFDPNQSLIIIEQETPTTFTSLPLQITAATFGDNWELKTINFEGIVTEDPFYIVASFDFMTGTGMTVTFEGTNDQGPIVNTTEITGISNFKSAKVPEPTSILGLLTIGSLGLLGKRKQQ